ncbi:MAG: hypothetical protein RMK29_08590 [Myxococcales bacterium]|nr:hypothetical protein [Myxococcota bacterium]MDW8281753.1 hypothetical protein [Myxococcales bacterium]
MRIQTFADPPALLRGLIALRQEGLTPRGLLFLALDPGGGIHLAVPGDLGQGGQMLRVGEKLTLRWPGPPSQRLYHFDSIHVLRDDFYVVNGDRRLAHPGDAIEVALVMAGFLRWCRSLNVFFGCTPHQPGSWLLGGQEVVALHDLGIVEVLPVQMGLLARRMHDHRLYLLTFADIARTGHLEDWLPVFSSPLGNILLLERRLAHGQLVLSCERGLVEVDVSQLPGVQERARLPVEPQPLAYAVVGRLDGQAFAVTRGRPRPWGLEDLQPAELVAAPAGQLSDMSPLLFNTGSLVAKEI